MLSIKNKIFKRVFDFSLSFVSLLIFLFPIFILILLASISSRSFGLFSQQRIGKSATSFTMYKIKSMREIRAVKGSKWETLDKNHITIKGDLRITKFGLFLRRFKFDELPQLYNVLIGDMSFVGPRPDVQGYADELQGGDVIILSVKPGITGPATLEFRNEEELLSKQENPVAYNNEIIWPRKIQLNKSYVESWSFKKDLFYIYQTIFN